MIRFTTGVFYEKHNQYKLGICIAFPNKCMLNIYINCFELGKFTWNLVHLEV